MFLSMATAASQLDYTSHFGLSMNHEKGLHFREDGIDVLPGTNVIEEHSEYIWSELFLGN